jgi:hypothetical protein
MGDALDGQVVGLGRTGGEDDLARVGADQLCHLITGQIDRLFGLPAESGGNGKLGCRTGRPW